MAALRLAMRIPFACFVLACAAFAGCADSTDDTDLAAARSRWENQIHGAYLFTWQQSCECLRDMTRPIEITVTGDQIKNAVYADDRTPVGEPTRGLLLTVDGVFDRIQQAVDEDAERIAVDYDRTWGFPATVFVDYRAVVADEELALTLSDFAPITR
jgi:Family of unknown function (DUF6174)